ncbi:MAG TPA: radical SAM family heme chaperone HemW [Opitutaceae bacterium]|nr:radical SAM family heme chaperone HemW [Opitutaceae bacterium]
MGTQQKDPALAMSELTGAKLESAGEITAPLGLYVHVPFCASTCDFCAFYQVKPDAGKVRDYFTGLEREIQLVEWGKQPSTVFFGGGTPGLLSPAQLEQLGQLVHALTPAAGLHEWTVELAPASVTEARLEALKNIGVTRISLGVQSLRPTLLDALGRQHTREQVLRAYELIRQRDFQSVNLDLMFALPGQSESEWLADLDEALALQPDHLSTYCLTFEEDTALWVKLSQGKVKLDPEREAALYERTWERLSHSGFGQYEVSNFARPGHFCRHNVNTWQMFEWVGLGPSAASQSHGWRGANVADLAKWGQHLEKSERMTEDRTRLSALLLLEDSLIFGLRMNAGVDWDRVQARFLGRSAQSLAPELDTVNTLLQHLESEGLVHRSDSRIALTTRGRLLADSVGSEIMAAFPETLS